MAYGQALKDRVLAAYDEGSTTRPIAERFKVSESWCRRVKQRRDEPPRKIGGGTFKLDEQGCTHLRKLVAQTPDATLEELRTQLQIDLKITISIGALWDTLHRRLKLPLKKSRWSPRSRAGPMSPRPVPTSSPRNSRTCR